VSVAITTLIIPVSVAVVAMSSTVEAQSSGKLALVGVLHPGSQPLGLLEAFRDGLRELGYVEGRDVKLEWRFADGQSERLPRLARGLVNLKVDAILAITTQAAQAAKSTSGTIPIIIARVTDPVGTGLVASLARPGGNITGLSAMTGELSAKRLQLLKEALPQARRVAADSFSLSWWVRAAWPNFATPQSPVAGPHDDASSLLLWPLLR